MAYPKLVRGAKTPVRVVITSESTNEYGEREVLLDSSLLCNYQDVGSVRHTADKQTPEVTGTIYIDGDILPGIAVISCGYVIIFGERRDIKKGRKARNLDGSVNYTYIEVS
jgi:hypothetical protein